MQVFLKQAPEEAGIAVKALYLGEQILDGNGPIALRVTHLNNTREHDEDPPSFNQANPFHDGALIKLTDLKKSFELPTPRL